MGDPSTTDIINNSVSKLNCSPEDKELVKQALTQVIENGKTIMEAVGFSKDQVELIYEYGYDLYKNSKFLESNQTFQFLSMLNPNDYRFVFGSGASFHKMNNFDKAIPYYWAAIKLDPANPMPWFHLSDCYLQKEDPILAEAMLQKTIDVAGINPHYVQIKEQANVLKEVLSSSRKGEPLDLNAILQENVPAEMEINNNEPSSST